MTTSTTLALTAKNIEKDLELIKAMQADARRSMTEFIHAKKNSIPDGQEVQWAESYADGSWMVSLTREGYTLGSYACETLSESIERDLKTKSLEEKHTGEADPWAFQKTYAEKEVLGYLNYEIIEFFFRKLKNL